MPSIIAILTPASALAFLTIASASDPSLRVGSSAGRSSGLSLDTFQRELHTGLDAELDLIACHNSGQQNTQSPATRRANIRRRDVPSRYYSPEHVWSHLLQHAWTVAESTTREENAPLTLLSKIDQSSYHLQCPFLICTNSGEDASLLFQEKDRWTVWTPQGGNCVILTTTSTWALDAMDSNRDIIAQPLVDIMKISPGTIESVTSPAWQVPFQDVQDAPQVGAVMGKNSSDVANIQHWERTLTISLVPGLEIHEEADLLELVNTMMRDVQKMSEVGWLLRQKDEDSDSREQYLMEHSLVGVPPLFEMFSLTSSSIKYQQDGEEEQRHEFNKNDRLDFWDKSLENGLESTHACSSLFSTLLVDTAYSSYDIFDVVLNPDDGRPPEDFESSASNIHCVTSFIAGLSVHPNILGIESNLPEYHGWSLAHTF